MVAGLGVLHCRSYISKHMADFASGVALVSASEGVASSSVTLVSATTLIIYLLVILIYPITDFDLHSTNPQPTFVRHYWQMISCACITK